MSFAFFEEFNFCSSTKMPSAATMQTAVSVHHNVLKPALAAIWLPVSGPAICATLHAMEYRAAYCPRLYTELRSIQNEFMKGIESISPIVMSVTEKTAVIHPAGKIFKHAKDSAATK